MSAIIKNIYASKNCFLCPFATDDRKGIRCNADNQKVMLTWQPQECPLIPLPEHHGRLIDADAIIRALEDGLEEIARKHGEDIAIENIYAQTTIRLLLAAPTIVEAEG